MKCLDYLQSAEKVGAKPIFVVYGPERFLVTQALATVSGVVLGSSEESMGPVRFQGPEAALAAVLDELSTLPFLAKRRLVIVEEAEAFVTRHRQALEEYVEKPSRSGVLVLVPTSWRSNTRLAKAVDKIGTAIECAELKPYEVERWVARRASQQYRKKLPPEAAALLVELAGTELGVVDQEVAKLAVYVGERGEIGAEDVDRLVAGSRVESVWKIMDALAAKRVDEALALLDRLLLAGEDPHAILGALGSQLRKLAAAGRWAMRGQSLGAALREAGVPPFAIERAEAQVRSLGRERVGLLYRWLLEANLDLKGATALPERTVLERLLVRLAGEPAKAAHAEVRT